MSSGPPASLESTSDPGVLHHVSGDGSASLVLEASSSVLVSVHVPSPALGSSHASVNSSSEFADSFPGTSVSSAGLSEDMLSVSSELASSVMDEGLDGSLGLRLELLVGHEVSGNTLGITLLGGVSLEVSHDSLAEHLLGVVSLGVRVDGLLDGLDIHLVNLDGLGSHNGKGEDCDDLAEHLFCV